MKQLKLVEDLDVSDEFVLIPSKTSMKKVIKLLAQNPNSAMLVQDKKSGKVIGVVDNEDVQRFEADGQKVKKGNVDKWMGTNILEIIDKTPLARLPQLLPEKKPDAVIVNDVTGKFKGFLSPADYKLASGDNSSQPEASPPTRPDIDGDGIRDLADKDGDGDEISDSGFDGVDSPPKPKRGPPKSSKNMKVESHSVPPQEQEEAPKLIIEEIHEDDQVSSADAFFGRVRGRSVGDFNDPQGELAEQAWSGAEGASGPVEEVGDADSSPVGEVEYTGATGPPSGPPTGPPTEIPPTDVAIDEDSNLQPQYSSSDRPCPSCGETIKVAAKKCRFCMEWIDN